MYVSRSESHQQDKLKRKKRLRRLFTINMTLLVVIIVLLGAWLAAANSDKLKDLFGDTGGARKKQEEAQLPGNAGAGNDAAPADEEDSSTEEGSGENGDGERISLSFVGDLLVNEYVSAVTQREGYNYLYQPSLLYLSEPDLTAGNLEYPVTDRGVPVEGTPYVFKGSPETLPSMRDAGFDVLSLANNHTLDQGVEGMLDTMKHLDDAGISHMGAGSNDTEAFMPLIKEVRGTKVAYIGISRIIPFVSWKADKRVAGVAETYETKRAVAAIAKAKEQADIVVVMVHWGKERSDRPLPYQHDFGKQYIDAGADLVIGSHPHVLQGFEMYKGKWIAYSLGNFIFTSYPKGTAAETGVLDALCTKDGDCDLKFHPMITVKAQPTPLEADAAKALFDRLTSISFGVKLREDGVIVPN
ncbi:CapA family protein [Paenibacillus alkaliterrae]|uniref:CapA family protein n=1 Tax=Paenibacillus alkaliterrae TaxID=320909 RepID=UPI001F1D2D31|nr:CapA family protein [Paenibacillus alkaliterrae]MCF2938775.1 CapA family protein [Paenibacillus alkaliterrae]